MVSTFAAWKGMLLDDMRVRRLLLVAFVLLGGCTRDRSLTSEKVVAFTRALSAWYDETAAAGLAGTINANEMTNRQVEELSMLKNQIGLGPGDIDAIDAMAHVVMAPSPVTIDDTRRIVLEACKPALADYAEHQRRFYAALSTVAARHP